MFKISFFSLALLVSDIYGQEIFNYALPESFISQEVRNYTVNDQYSILGYVGSGKLMKFVLFDKLNGEKISEFNCSRCNMTYLGSSVTEKNIYLYVDGFWNGDKGNFSIRFEKKVNSYPFTSKFGVDDNISIKDKLILSFSDNNSLNQVYLIEKRNELVVFKIATPEKITAVKYSINENESKELKDRVFSMNSLRKDDALISNESRAFMIDDRLTLLWRSSVYNDKKIKVLQLGEPLSRSEVKINEIGEYYSGFLVGEFLIVFRITSEVFVGDKLRLQLFNWKTNTEVKSFNFDSKTEGGDIEIIDRSPVYTTEGDSLDHKWAANDKRKKIYKIFDSYMTVAAHRIDDGRLLITLANEIVRTSPGGVYPGGGVSGGGVSPTGEFNFFRIIIDLNDNKIVKGDYSTPFLRYVKMRGREKIDPLDVEFDKKFCHVVTRKKGVYSVVRLVD